VGEGLITVFPLPGFFLIGLEKNGKKKKTKKTVQKKKEN